jgi:hypothetical protein
MVLTGTNAELENRSRNRVTVPAAYAASGFMSAIPIAAYSQASA